MLPYFLSLKSVFVFCLMLLLSPTVHAFNLVGSWELLSIEREVAGQWQSDCTKPTGMIIYTESGYMAAGLNCMQADDPQKPSFAGVDTAFYTGTYTRDGNTIRHQVKNAASARYYGTMQVRELEVVDENTLFLRVKSATSEWVRLKWRRVG